MSHFELDSGLWRGPDEVFDEGVINPRRKALLDGADLLIDQIDEVVPEEVVPPSRRMGQIVTLNTIPPVPVEQHSRIIYFPAQRSVPTDTSV